MNLKEVADYLHKQMQDPESKIEEKCLLSDWLAKQALPDAQIKPAEKGRLSRVHDYILSKSPRGEIHKP